MNATISTSPVADAQALEQQEALSPLDASSGSLLGLLLHRQPPSAEAAAAPGGVVIAELLALTDGGRTPLLALPGQEHRATPALSVVDLHGAHVGAQVAVMFESAGAARPIVMGVLRGQAAWPLESRPDQVEVDADGRRMVVHAKEQLVLRCGDASITLTRAGKVLIEGTYVVSHSSGVNRVKGGSVQLN